MAGKMFPDAEIRTHPWHHRVWMKLLEVTHLFGKHYPITSYDAFDDGKKVAVVKSKKCSLCGVFVLDAEVEVIHGADKGGS